MAVVPCYMHNPMDFPGSRSPLSRRGTLWRSIQAAAASWTGRNGSEGAPPPAVDGHPSREDLARLFHGELPRERVWAILAHLLPGCTVCQGLTTELWSRGLTPEGTKEPQSSDGSEYDGAVAQVFDRIRQAHRKLEAERSEANQAVFELASSPAERRRLLVLNSPRFHTWGVCERLLDRIEQIMAGQPEEALTWAELAVVVAGHLAASTYPASSLEDLRARAFTALADVHRLLGDLAGAERALRAAEAHRARGTGDKVEKARLLDAEASLRRAQGREKEASRLLDRAITLYRRTGQKHLWSRALIRQGHARFQAGDLEGGIALVQQGIRQMEGRSELRRWLLPSPAGLFHSLTGKLRRRR